jgi:hypothetical protein
MIYSVEILNISLFSAILLKINTLLALNYSLQTKLLVWF